MENREPVEQTMAAADVPQRWSELVGAVAHGETRLVIEQDGALVAAIISARGLERLNRLVAQREERFKALEASWEAFKGVPEDG